MEGSHLEEPTTQNVEPKWSLMDVVALGEAVAYER